MAVVQFERALVILMVLYVLACICGFLASIPMILHVYPQSECLLFSSVFNDNFRYGHYGVCNTVGYVYLIVIVAGMGFIFVAFNEKRKRHGHAKAGHFEEQRVPKRILIWHVLVSLLTLLLTIIVTVGYVSACNDLHEHESKDLQKKFNEDPYNTRGEEIQTRHEDDYKFHRYTNVYGNAFGSEFYTIRITCRSIFTDPETHQKLHDSHFKDLARYYGYWYGQDLYTYDSQYEATRTNALIEASLAGSWLCLCCWLAGLILMIVQRCVMRKEEVEAERMSTHSAMMGSMHRDGSVAGSYARRADGSMISGSNRNSSFQRGGSRGSDHSMRSTRRDIDDIALSMHHMGGSQHFLGSSAGNGVPVMSSGYGRKDIDDMVRSSSHNVLRKPATFHRQNSLQMDVQQQPHAIMILQGDPLQTATNTQNYRILNQHIAQNSRPDSHYSSHETGYISGPESNFYKPPNNEPESTYLHREEVETEIF